MTSPHKEGPAAFQISPFEASGARQGPFASPDLSQTGAVLGVDFVPGMKAAWREPGKRLSASLRVEAAAGTSTLVL